MTTQAKWKQELIYKLAHLTTYKTNILQVCVKETKE